MTRELSEKKVKEYIISMPSLPTTVSKILDICNDPKTSPVDLNHVISLDPVLMGRVLKLINSAYYGLGQQVTSLVRAIIMLGINTVKNLALSTAVLAQFGDKKVFQALNMEGFWRHSLATASTARLIAKNRGVDPKYVEEYFAAGLLHDIGKIPLNNVLSEYYLETMRLADRDRIPLFQAEQTCMLMDHTISGTFIAQAWKLDDPISDTIKYHHSVENYEGLHVDVLYTVTVANYFVTREGIGFSGNRYPSKLPPQILENLSLSRDKLDEITDSVSKEIEKAKVFLKLQQ